LRNISIYPALGTVILAFFIFAYLITNSPQLIQLELSLMFLLLSIPLMAVIYIYGMLKEQFEVLKLKYSHAHAKEIGFDALSDLFGTDFSRMVKVCEHLKPENIRHFIRDYIGAHLNLKNQYGEGSESFRLMLKEITGDLKQKYHLELDTYSLELGNPQEGLGHLDLVFRCRICGQQVGDLAEYHKQIHAAKTLK
jgi:hypothetical protein